MTCSIPASKMTLMDSLCGIGDRLSRRSQGGFQHSILNVSAADFVVVREDLEIDVGGEWRPGWMQLRLPDLDTFRLSWQLEEDVGPDPETEPICVEMQLFLVAKSLDFA